MNKNTRGRQVEMYGPDGVTLRTFSNAKEAMEETEVHRRMIYACCYGRHSAWIHSIDGSVKFRFAEKRKEERNAYTRE